MADVLKKDCTFVRMDCDTDQVIAMYIVSSIRHLCQSSFDDVRNIRLCCSLVAKINSNSSSWALLIFKVILYHKFRFKSNLWQA